MRMRVQREFRVGCAQHESKQPGPLTLPHKTRLDVGGPGEGSGGGGVEGVGSGGFRRGSQAFQESRLSREGAGVQRFWGHSGLKT